MQIVTCAICEGVHEASNFMSHENIFMSCHCTVEVVKNATQPMKHCLYLTKMEEKNKNTMKYIYKDKLAHIPTQQLCSSFYGTVRIAVACVTVFRNDFSQYELKKWQ